MSDRRVVPLKYNGDVVGRAFTTKDGKVTEITVDDPEVARMITLYNVDSDLYLSPRKMYE